MLQNEHKAARIMPVAAALTWATAPAIAQVPDDPAMVRMVGNANAYWRLNVAAKGSDCRVNGKTSDDIVVCARREEDRRLIQAIPTPDRPDPKLVAVAGGPHGSVGATVTFSVCILQKCPKKLYFIDLKSIPEAPPGSEADRIAKGELRAR